MTNKKLWITLSVTVVLLGGIILLYIFLPVVANKAQTSAIIKIPAGATTEVVYDSLAKYYGDKYASKVILMSKLRKADYAGRHGAYKVDSGMTPLQAEAKLRTGSQHPFMITVNASRGVAPLTEKLASKLEVTPDSLQAYIANPANLEKYGLTPEQALALFIDDSYQVYWSSSPQKVVDKIGDNYNKIWNKERLAKAKALGLSPVEVITLASIVDEETNKINEKPMVARLYLNRLGKGMKLQADPTVKFALGDFSLRRILSEHLNVDSPYNTYKIAGLPPGPIRTVTLKDIDAVLDAPPHDYIYMCAKDDFSGYHTFAKDYSTHLQNAHKYQKALNRRGIK